ncbi:lipoprotein-releasing system ATP-binding protein LolD [Thiomicrorhabdus immobilis]|uniref:Lipoprotein-releasing system ATP-binding protein LolD n=1 Tax=Thiomicrorhabdus immobilis TaxID=2791037 RepID=A0ABN6CWC3_9GAMM|nr:lipoprotein-releasing ABC transporter ATP-binding protein LolD [Thiomicrorhabdus immobilis]BCN93321.1 lipoprotein-releasing system ATP-binding protein LolD [Thiomicrorhabdus immobilis]
MSDEMNKTLNEALKPVVLEAIGLEKTYKEAEIETKVFSDIDFQLNAGEKVAIVGASGSGKSTLLHLLAGLDSPTRGVVTLNNQSFSEENDVVRGKLRNQYMGFVYQFHHLFSELTALENVMMPLQIRRVSIKEAEAKARGLLDKVGLADRALHKPSELSGGERQRVAIARALITNPACILADEPTGNLDYLSANQVFELLLKLNSDLGTALLIVTHDRNLAAQMDRQVTLLDGNLISS